MKESLFILAFYLLISGAAQTAKTLIPYIERATWSIVLVHGQRRVHGPVPPEVANVIIYQIKAYHE